MRRYIAESAIIDSEKGLRKLLRLELAYIIS